MQSDLSGKAQGDAADGEKLKRPLIHCEMVAKLNFACQQSSFAILRELRIENRDTAAPLQNLVVRLSSNPTFLKPKSWRLDRVAPAESIALSDRHLDLDGGFLLKLDDAVRGTVTISIESDGFVLEEATRSIELLAYNEWGGAGYMPELLAAFSMPNDPAVDRVLRDASLILRKAGKMDGIEGYKSGSRQRVWEIASAIYTAICNLRITYSLPPASFEQDGQKIRLPSQILESRIGTCLDCTMLFSSALEQAGLNPIIALPQGHAVVGVWLQPEELTTIVIDEAETLRKRLQLNELILIETTFTTNHPAPPFSRAVAAARDVITPDRDNGFNAAVDIRRARAHRIIPLGLRLGHSSERVGDDASDHVELALEEAPVLPDFDGEVEDDQQAETPAGRLERWQRKLLDLTARNPLLNHRSQKASLRLICPDPGFLEDKLSEGGRISIQPIPKSSGQTQDADLHRQRTGEVITEEYAREALKKGQVLVDLPSDELCKRSVEIYRRAQTSLQEGGANTLYLALGFLLWKRDAKDERQFRAPLILLPVTLERRSVRSGIRMLAHDDEPRFNTTLVQMLRKDFEIHLSELDGALPKDDSGIDVDGIWNTVRRAVKDAPGFEVVEDVVLGHYSFAKYLMWKDLVDRTDALRKSSVVRHLIDTPRESYQSEVGFVDGAQVDQLFKPSDLLIPLPADASQTAAIATADRGKDFVVIGPPGTGKSQTISNLIAHLLGRGKTVLFVSEKTAALDVVYRRLRDVGLGQFCLELHSNKARKADVLAQLSHAWARNTVANGNSWESEAESLRQLRDKLNQVVDRLHMRRRNGMTAHYAMGIKIREEKAASRVALSWPDPDRHDEKRLQDMRQAVENLRVQAVSVASVSDGAFRLISQREWSPQWEDQVVNQARRLSSAATRAERTCEAFLRATELAVPGRSISRLDALADLATVLLESHRRQSAFALEPEGPARIEALEEAVTRLRSYADAQAALSCSYYAMAWRTLDGDEILHRWQEAKKAWWLKRMILRRRLINDMRRGGAQGLPDPVRDAATLKRLRTEGLGIDHLDNKLAGLKDWKRHETDAAKASALHDLGQRLRNALGRLADDPETSALQRSTVHRLVHDNNELLAQDAVIGRMAKDYQESYKELRESIDALEASAVRSVRAHFAGADRALADIRETAEQIVDRQVELREWCGWQRRREEAMNLQLGPLVDGVEQDRIHPDELVSVFEAAYCTWWSRVVIGEDDVLRTFSTPEHVATIEKFRKTDQQFREVTAAYISAVLTGRLPESDGVKRSTSWGVLRHEIQKKKQHKPIRQLIQEIPDVLTQLTPCLMMSPLSVAQYLPADQALFDVVIFDEASQITVWDAVGSLARGRQVIVAGDPKQMPPTNFFSRSDDDPDGDIDQDCDLESILDEMLSAGVPSRTINLHYRSRKESLIAFSNSRYYGNELVTFPAPVHPDLGVRLIKSDGHYLRGSARTNPGEARAIVGEILRRLTHRDESVRNLSIGVVTFNAEQQSLIENLLDEERMKHPEIERAFATEGLLEPVFVKNLETVQGDERDVILFSVTYGPDQSGHLTLNFGPLNRVGGERRLNVAMTRARHEMLVFSSLSADQIDLSRTQARAVADLKHFLQYAEHGRVVLGSAVYSPAGDFESPFESAVARSLRARGWEVHPQVGVSAYRIDLGVAHPKKPGVYLAGVECDGAMYHSSSQARERDIIRQKVLENLGWNILRVWSTDWWTNHAGALDKLDMSLREFLSADGVQESQQAHVAKDEPASP